MNELTAQDLKMLTVDWYATNDRRLKLIDKKFERTISPCETKELEHLQSLAKIKREMIQLKAETSAEQLKLMGWTQKSFADALVKELDNTEN